MMKTGMIVGGALALAISLTCLTGAGDAQSRGAGFGAGLEEVARMPPVPLPTGTQVERDLAYGTDPSQRLDVYRLATTRDAPIIILVHGGGWFRGDKANNGVVGNKVAHWVPKGYIVVSLNYRLVPLANPREQADDVAKALAYVQGQAAKWGGNPGRVVMIGHSAGAHLVALLGAKPSIATAAGAKPWLGTVALDSAAYDVTKVMSSAHFALYDKAFGTDQALWQAASPMAQLEGTPAPMLLVCSSKRADSCPMANDFAAKVRERKGRAEVLPEAMTHGEINAYLGTARAYTDQVDKFLASLGLK